MEQIRALQAAIDDRLGRASALPGQFRRLLSAIMSRAADFAEKVAADPRQEKRCRQAAVALYHAATAALLAAEGAALGAAGGDARRLLLARLVLAQRLAPQDPFALPDDSWEDAATSLLLSDASVPLEKAAALVWA